MKTIAVLTDFSERAVHASRFALHIAKKMKAGVLLFNVSPIPASTGLVFAGDTDSSWDLAEALACFALSMETDMRGRSFPGTYFPEVTCKSESSDLVDVMTAIMRDEDICMIVVPPASNVELTTYLEGDIFNRIVDWATVPVLVVPENTPVKNFEKIAFASALHEEDINSIAELGELMQNFGAELMVAHLNTNPADEKIRERENKLNRSLYEKLCCGGVYFRSIPDTAREKNWDWLKANKKADLLAVVKQPREQMALFFKRGHNLQISYHLTTPVIILPKRP